MNKNIPCIALVSQGNADKLHAGIAACNMLDNHLRPVRAAVCHHVNVEPGLGITIENTSQTRLDVSFFVVREHHDGPRLAFYGAQLGST
jgi:hypothetical protein